MANFDVQITDLVGGTIDSAACNQWAADACREIIHQLPATLQAKCSSQSVLNATNGTTLDLDGKGKIFHVTRKSASNGYYIPCRRIDAAYADLANDSTDIVNYATVSDPVYYIASNSSDAGTLFVLPTPTDTLPSVAYHITYPSVSVADVDTIANFPDEAEPLVVLYVASKLALQFATTEADNEDSELYAMYSDMYAKLKAEYMQGLQALKGGEVPRR